MAFVDVEYGMGGGSTTELILKLTCDGLSLSAANKTSLAVEVMYDDLGTLKTLCNARKDSYITSGGTAYENDWFKVTIGSTSGYHIVEAKKAISYSTNLSSWSTLSAGNTYTIGFYTSGNSVYVKIPI